MRDLKEDKEIRFTLDILPKYGPEVGAGICNFLVGQADEVTQKMIADIMRIERDGDQRLEKYIEQSFADNPSANPRQARYSPSSSATYSAPLRK